MSLFDSIKKTNSQNIKRLFFGTVSGQGITLILSPILTRIFSPGDFGYYAVITSIINIISSFATFKYELAIPLIKGENNLKILVFLVTYLSISFSLLLFILLIPTSNLLSNLIEVPGLLLYFIPIGVLLISLFNILRYYSIRLGEYKDLSKVYFTQSLAGSITQLIGGTFRPISFFLILGYIIGQSSGILKLSKNKGLFSFKQCTKKRILKIASRFRNFPLITVPQTLINTSTLQLPQIILAFLHGPEVAGFYNLTQRVLQQPVRLIGNTVAQVYYGEAAKAENLKQIKALMLNYISKLAVISTLIGLILVIGSERLFGFIFGSEWITAGSYAKILVPFFILQTSISPVSQTLNIIEKQKIFLKWDIVRLLTTIIPFIIAGLLYHDPLVSLLVFTIGMVLNYLSLLYIIIKQLEK